MKKAFTLLMLIICVLSFTCCNAFSNVLSGGESGKNQNENVIKIGIIQPQEGRSAVGGKQEIIGAKYANLKNKKVILADKEYKIELVLKNTASNYTAAKEAAQSLLNEGVCAVIGSYGAEDFEDVYSVFSENGIPVISTSSFSAFESEKSDHIFRLAPSYYEEVKAVEAYMRNMFRVQKVLILCDARSSKSTACSLLFKELFEKNGGSVIVENFDSESVNFNSLLKKLGTKSFNAVYAPVDAMCARSFIESDAENYLAVPVFASHNWRTNEIVSLLSNKNINVYAPSFFSFENDSDICKNMKSWLELDDDLKDMNFSSDVSYVNMLSYAAYNLAVYAVKEANSFSKDDITNALYNISFTFQNNTFSFDKNGNRKDIEITVEKI